MNDDKDSSPAAQNDEDLNTTPPNPTPAPVTPPLGEADPPAAGKWTMPAPVFRKTSGYLPQGYERSVAGSEDPTVAPNPHTVRDDEFQASSDPATAVVEPQPDLAEVIIPEPETFSETSVAKTSSSNGIVWTILGILFIIGFIAVFLAVIYLFFLRPGGTGGLF